MARVHSVGLLRFCRYREYIGIIFLTILANGVILFTTIGWLRLLAGTLLFCCLPGYLVLTLLWARSPPLGPLERFTLSTGLSYAVSSALMLYLHLLPGGVTLGFFLLALDLLITGLLACCLISHDPIAGEKAEQSFVGKPLPFLLVLATWTAFLYFASLGFAEFNSDEIEMFWTAKDMILGRDDALFVAKRGPGPALIGTAFVLFTNGFRELDMRLPFALAGFLAVMTVYLLGREMFNWRTGFLAGMLMVLDGVFLGYTHFAGYPTVVVLMSVLTIYCFHHFCHASDEKISKRYLVLGSAFFTFGLLTHYAAILILPVLLFLYFTLGDGWRFFWDNSQALLLLGVVCVAILLSFYVPFVLHPQFTQTYQLYWRERVGGGQSFYNNLPQFIAISTFCNSVYYLLFEIVALAAVGAAYILEALPRRLPRYLLAALFIVNMFLSAFFPGALTIHELPYNIVIFLVVLLIFAASPHVDAAVRAIMVWFLSIFIAVAFLVRYAGLPLYTCVAPWALIAALGVDKAYMYGRKSLTGRWKRIYRLTVVIFLLGLYALFASYSYLFYVRTDLDYALHFPESIHPVYWTPLREFPEEPFVGFPYKAGWKVIGYLYRMGVLRGEYKTNARLTKHWWYVPYMLSKFPPPPRYFFFDEDSNRLYPVEEYSKEALGEWYDLIGQITVHGEPKLLIYESREFTPEVAFASYPVEDYESGYDQIVSLDDYRLYDVYGVDEYAFRDAARLIAASSREGDAILVSAPEGVPFLSYYYRGDLPYYPLPLQFPLDKVQTERELERIFTKHDRVYVLFWALDAKDSKGYIPGWLEEHAQRLTGCRFSNVRLSLYGKSGQGTAGEVSFFTDIILGGAIELIGVEVSEIEVEAGKPFQLALYWRAKGEIEHDYTVFTHLIDEGDRIWAQHDKPPLDGAHPTSEWYKGEVIRDVYDLIVTNDAPAGNYRLEVGMYDWKSGERLPVVIKGEQGPAADRVLLPQVVIVSRSN